MKKAKLILSAVAAVAVIGGAYAFTAKKHPADLYQKLTSNQTCEEADATSFNTGTSVSVPSGYTGFYTNSNCTGSTVTGYLPNAQ